MRRRPSGETADPGFYWASVSPPVERPSQRGVGVEGQRSPAAAAPWRGGLGAGLPGLLPGGNKRMYSSRPSCCGRGHQLGARQAAWESP